MATTPIPDLTPQQLEAFGAELDAIRQRVLDDLGERDVAYLRDVIRAQRGLEATGRGLMFVGFVPPAWLAGVAALSLSKILDNMEIGHNVMHGQYDWTRDPALRSGDFEWDNACPGDEWRHSHNYMHHTHTNVLGRDRDVGYSAVRIDEAQPWTPLNLGNPLYALLLALLFQYGVALHDLQVGDEDGGMPSADEMLRRGRSVATKIGRQSLRDYIVWPALTGPSAPLTFAGNLTANAVRNVWAFTIIFCGHFPDGVRTFTPEEVEHETRGGWYLRQLLGSANISGGPLFHIMSGNLSHQIEHHLFPDLPAHRYAEISGEVREICRRYGLPYNTGSLTEQFGSVVRKIWRFALPNRTEPVEDEAAPVLEPAAA
jgi:NADPH-dependent stearoyl-CoA 9-desaturase